MDSKGKQKVLAAIGLFIIAVISVGAYFAISYLIGLILALDKQISATIIATSGTILTAVATLVFTQYLSKKREILEAHRPNKIQAYKRFMELMISVLKKIKKDNNILEDGKLPEDLQDLYFALQSDMIIWGAPNVLRAYQNFRAQPPKDNILFVIDDVLQEIRKDLGHKKGNLKRGDLIKLFLIDPETLDKVMQ